MSRKPVFSVKQNERQEGADEDTGIYANAHARAPDGTPFHNTAVASRVTLSRRRGTQGVTRGGRRGCDSDSEISQDIFDDLLVSDRSSPPATAHMHDSVVEHNVRPQDPYGPVAERDRRAGVSLLHE